MKTAAMVLLLSSAAAAQVNVDGNARYEDRIYNSSGFTGTQFLPVRQAQVELLNSGVSQGFTTTDELGNFSFSGIATNPNCQVRIYARRSNGKINAVVRNNAGANAIYTFLSAAIDTSVKTTFDPINILQNGAGPIFNIFDCAVKSFQYLASLEPTLADTPPPMNIYWELNGNNGTFFDGSLNGIFLLGLTSDPDQYDDDIILHEIGHWIAFHFSKDDTLGGAHSVIDQLDPRTSWSEGWAHYWSAAVRLHFPLEYPNPNQQVDNFATSNSMFDIEAPSFPGFAIMATNELAVAAVLWDIIDSDVTEGFDGVSALEPQVWRTLSTRMPPRTNITLEDFHAGFTLEVAAVPGTIEAVTGSESTNGIFKSRKIRYYLDGSESNDSSSAPAPLALGPVGLTQRTFFGTLDDDWYTVDATPGTLVVETLNLGDGADTRLELYDATGSTLLDSNDDRSPSDRSSRISRSVAVATTFLVRVLRSGTVIEYGYYDLRAQIVVNGPPTIVSVTSTAYSGPAPLRVTLTAVLTDPDGGSYDHRWDFNGDGLIDWSSLQGPTVTTTYDEPGIFAATYRVVDSGDSLVVAAPVIITVSSAAAPLITPSVLPTSGSAPITVAFDAIVIGIVPTAYLWDFDGDGRPDAVSVTSAAASFTFRSAGTFSPQLVVRDSQGLAHRVVGTPVTVTATAPPTVTSFTATDGLLPYAATFDAGTSTLGGGSSVEFDFDGDGRYDRILPPGTPTATSATVDLQRAGNVTAKVRVTDGSSGEAVVASTSYLARSLGATGWLVDPHDGDRLTGDAVTLTAEVVPFGLVKSVVFQFRDTLGGPWTAIGSPLNSAGTVFTTTWDTSALAELSSFNLRVLVDGVVSSGDTANTVVKDSVAPTLVETAAHRSKEILTDRTTVTRNAAGVWILIPLGSTGNALPLDLLPAVAPPPSGTAGGMVQVGPAWQISFAGTFGNAFQLRLPFSGDGTNVEIHHYDSVAGAWTRLGYPRISHADGWAEGDVNSAGIYALFGPPAAPVRHHRHRCGALGLEALAVVALLRLLRRRC